MDNVSLHFGPQNVSSTLSNPINNGLLAMARRKTPKYMTDLFLYAELARPAIVYQARNVNNGNLYIGVTRTTLIARRNKHFSEARRGTRGRFYNAIRKHGPEAFEFTLLKTCPSYHEALAEEVSQIAALNPAYNVTRGGEGALGYKHTKAEIERMRQRKLGKPGYWRGKERPPETREKFRQRLLANPLNFWLGKKRDQATIDKIKQTKKGCKAPSLTPLMVKARAENMRRAARARRKPVICLDDGQVYPTTAAAAQAYGFNANAVAGVCNPNKPNVTTLYGKRFAYLENLK